VLELRNIVIAGVVKWYGLPTIPRCPCLQVCGTEQGFGLVWETENSERIR